MSFVSTTSLASKSRGESQVFLPLEAGIVPFPLRRTTLCPPARYVNVSMPNPVDKPEAAPVPAPRSTRSALRLAVAVAHITHEFLREIDGGVLSDAQKQVITDKDIGNEDAASVWFTSPNNWRPGLLTLEQAAMRADIVHRPEGFEGQ